MDYYAVLGVSTQATASEIKAAYRRLSKLYHPDMNRNDPHYTDRFIQVKQAYDVLKETGTRARYDRSKNQYHQTDSVVYASEARKHAIVNPVIHSFTCAQSYFFEGDVLHFTWDCKEVDTIRILPFGYVSSLSGTVSFKINNYSKRYLPIELVATQTKTGRVVRKGLVLENGAYRKFSKSEKEFEGRAAIRRNEALLQSFFNPIGRLSRKEFGKRILVILGVALMIYVLYDMTVPILWIAFLTVLLSFSFLTQTARRFQDFGWSPMFSVLIMVPYLNLVVFVVLLALRGNRGVNRYGRPVQ